MRSSPFSTQTWAALRSAAVDRMGENEVRWRALGAFFLAGGGLALITLLLPAEPGARRAAIAALALVAVAGSSVMIAGARRLPEREVWLSSALGAGTLLISGGVYFTGVATAPLALIYVWVAFQAFFFFGRARAWRHLAFVGACYGAVLVALGGSGGTAAARWLMTIGTVAVVGALADVLRERADRLIAKLAETARTDPLTGLLNRRGFEELLVHELERGRRTGQPVSLIVGDLDHFKTINDRFGHREGDHALRRFSDLAMTTKRQTDGAARIGGEEFALVLADTDEHEAFVLAERLRSRVGWAFTEEGLPLTASFGIATASEERGTADQVLHSADQAMYMAKRLGRDRSVIFSANLADTLRDLDTDAEAPEERRVRAERELRSARDYLRAVTDSMGEGVCAVDTEGRVAYVNGAAERMLGWTSEELRGKQLHETVHFRRPDGAPYPAADCPMVGARRSGEVARIEDDEFVRKDGTSLPVAYTSSPIEMEDGVRGAVVIFRDITERKLDEQRLDRDLDALMWLSKIRDALEQELFTLYAQPIVDVTTGETVQHELLIRMLDEDGGVVPPGAFLPAAERYGPIREIDRWVIHQAAVLAGRGHAIELNVSAESLGDPDLYDVFERELSRAGADPALVVIELTETALLRNEDAARAFIERVETLGCRVALDDFGTGYGGFSYVKRLPVDFLKIDLEFVRDLPRDLASQNVVRAIVHLARDFGYSTVAEGVEDDETLSLLREFGVDYAQGYGIGRPAPIEQTALAGPAARLQP